MHRRIPEFGLSLSIKQCRNFGVKSGEVITAAIDDLCIRRFRLMSYWDEIEPTPGIYDWQELDSQIAAVASRKGTVSLCLGVRQPRWPESHWPDWAWNLASAERNAHLLKFMTAVVNRYKSQTIIVSYQLENEALLKSFGERGDFDRRRLLTEYKLIKQLDPKRPLSMSTSTSWGIPIRQPVPDMIGFSLYTVVYGKRGYNRSIYLPWIFKLRTILIRLMWHKPVFIHELQAEPWGPKNIWNMDRDEQSNSMNERQLRKNIQHARQTNLSPIDLWGVEWWYHLKVVDHQPGLWETAKQELNRD